MQLITVVSWRRQTRVCFSYIFLLSILLASIPSYAPLKGSGSSPVFAVEGFGSYFVRIIFFLVSLFPLLVAQKKLKFGILQMMP